MRCPIAPGAEDCTNDTPCPVCPTVVTLPTRAVALGTAWDYTREDGWHEPEVSE